jgi:hypothetical protein
MSVIFPGNYVAHLNAYRDQGVVAIPGVEFYRLVGAVLVNPDNDSISEIDGSLAIGTYACKVLSPDLRQDDKPRMDRPMTIPAGAVVYRTAISAPGLQEATVAGTTTIVLETLGGNAPGTGTLTAEADGFFSAEGVSSALNGIVDGSAVSATDDTDVEVTTDAILVPALKPSAGACRNSPSAILVEVCYYLPAPAPDVDDVSIPYAIEAGQGY